MEDEYFDRLGDKINFDSTSFYHKHLIVMFIIGIVFSGLGMILSFVNSMHIFGFWCGLVSLIIGLVGCFYLSRIPIHKKDRKWFCLPSVKKDKMYMRLFFFILYFVFISLVLIFIILKVISLANKPNITSFPKKWEPSGGCSRVMVWEDNHRDSKVNPNNVFTIVRIGVSNTKDLIFSWIDKQTQAFLEFSDKNKSKGFFHVNFSSIFFGFIDDMFIEVIPCTETSGGAQEISLALNIQSQSRIGSTDFGTNPRRISEFLEWMSNQLPDMYIANRNDACMSGKNNKKEEDDKNKLIIT